MISACPSHADPAIQDALDIAHDRRAPRPDVAAFHDPVTGTVTYVVRDPRSRACAIVDSVLDFDAISSRTGTGSLTGLSAFVRDRQLSVDWLLETHVHADHLSAAPLLRERGGGRVAIGRHIDDVRRTLGPMFGLGEHASAEEFDTYFADGDCFAIGELRAIALHAPGHTPACVAYLIGDALFTGDTLFMPDCGTARCDFPGGDAGALYRSIRRLFALPNAIRVFVGHDYGARDAAEVRWETTIGAQRVSNVQVADDVDEATFVARRRARDATLALPRLMIPAVQVNLRGGNLPPPEPNGVRYLKLPIDIF